MSRRKLPAMLFLVLVWGTFAFFLITTALEHARTIHDGVFGPLINIKSLNEIMNVDGISK